MSSSGHPLTTSSRCARRECVGDDRVRHNAEVYPVSLWQQVASPVWMDIDPNDTLQYRTQRARTRRRAAHLPVAVRGHPPRHRVRHLDQPRRDRFSLHGHRNQKGTLTLRRSRRVRALASTGRKVRRVRARRSYYEQGRAQPPRCDARRSTLFGCSAPDRSGCVASAACLCTARRGLR